jgi:hypothetical protein
MMMAVLGASRSGDPRLSIRRLRTEAIIAQHSWRVAAHAVDGVFGRLTAMRASRVVVRSMSIAIDGHTLIKDKALALP